jgi:hypothetical protein
MEVEKTYKHWAFKDFLKLETDVIYTLSTGFRCFFLKLIFKSLIEHWSFVSIDSLLSMLIWNESTQRALKEHSSPSQLHNERK